ncbi:hypothetical protein BN133_727 [Cronobacter dublinensis 582]|nr:hypothetical protein BN133_727 [Cronobacter dublinensis 582]
MSSCGEGDACSSCDSEHHNRQMIPAPLTHAFHAHHVP